MRIEGVSVVAERLKKAVRSAFQEAPHQATTTANTSARDQFKTGVDMDPGTIIQESIDTRCLPSWTA